MNSVYRIFIYCVALIRDIDTLYVFRNFGSLSSVMTNPLEIYDNSTHVLCLKLRVNEIYKFCSKYPKSMNRQNIKLDSTNTTKN